MKNRRNVIVLHETATELVTLIRQGEEETDSEEHDDNEERDEYTRDPSVEFGLY
jgi:hypothetical protein